MNFLNGREKCVHRPIRHFRQKLPPSHQFKATVDAENQNSLQTSDCQPDLFLEAGGLARDEYSQTMQTCLDRFVAAAVTAEQD